MPDRLQYKNFYLLLLLVAYFISNSLLAEEGQNNYITSVGLGFTILLCLNIIEQNEIISKLTIALSIFAAMCFLLVAILQPSTGLYIVHFSINCLFLVAVTIVQIRAVAIQNEITINTLLGAICGYLLIGLTWTYFYLALAHSSHHAFYPEPNYQSFRMNLNYFTYFSFSTLTTLGFGDVVPVTHFARTLTWMEAAIGQIYLAVWISQLVAIHIAQRIRGNKL
jgi:voltage-gated potassium channel